MGLDKNGWNERSDIGFETNWKNSNYTDADGYVDILKPRRSNACWLIKQGENWKMYEKNTLLAIVDWEANSKYDMHPSYDVISIQYVYCLKRPVIKCWLRYVSVSLRLWWRSKTQINDTFTHINVQQRYEIDSNHPCTCINAARNNEFQLVSIESKRKNHTKILQNVKDNIHLNWNKFNKLNDGGFISVHHNFIFVHR